MKRLSDPIARNAAGTPDHPAVICAGSVTTYSQLAARIQIAASWLSGLGVRPGDRVAIVGENSLDWIGLAHAMPLLGAILVPINPRWSPSEAARWIAHVEPALILVGDQSAGSLTGSVLHGARVVRLSEEMPGEGDVIPPATEALPAEFDLDQIHTIMPTSGSGGAPKGVCLTLRNHLASALASAVNLGVDRDDRWLLNLPLCHIGGLAILMRAAFYGTTVVLHRTFDAQATLAAITEDRVTHLSLVGTTLLRLLKEQGDRTFPGHVRAALVGGGPVHSELLREARARGLPVLPTYGMTEASSQVATLSPRDTDDNLCTAGQPLTFCEIEISDEDGKRASPGEAGQVRVRGPMLAKGYWTAPGQIEPLTRDGWFATSDVGSLDDDGFLTIHGRRDNVIISGGEKLFPEEIETALEQIAGIDRAAVAGIDDPEWGQTIVAMIEPSRGATFDEESIRDSLARHLARYKLPRRFIRVEALPTLTNGKIDRGRLRALLQTVSK